MSETITKPQGLALSRGESKRTTIRANCQDNNIVIDIIIMVKDQNGKRMMLRGVFLDSGCSQTIILK